MAYVTAVNISSIRGVRKNAVPEIQLKKDWGIIGDAHAGNWHRQISLLADESVDKLRNKLPNLDWGAFAENINIRGMVLYTLPVGTKLCIGETVVEVTQIGKECHNDCEIRRITGDCVMPREGIFAKVIKEGIVKAGDEVIIL